MRRGGGGEWDMVLIKEPGLSQERMESVGKANTVQKNQGENVNLWAKKFQEGRITEGGDWSWRSSDLQHKFA